MAVRPFLELLTEMLPTLLLAAVGVGALWFSRRGRKVRGGEPRCSHCGYIVRGLPGPVCPECGADLNRPGAVAAAGGRVPSGKWSRTLGWTVFCILSLGAVLGFVWGNFVAPRLPRVREIRQDYTLGYPASGAYQSIRVFSGARGIVREGRPDPVATAVTLELQSSHGAHFSLDVDLPTLAYEYTDAHGQHRRGSALDAGKLLDWFHETGIDGDPVRLAAETDYLLREIRDIQHTGAGLRHNIYPTYGMSASRGSLSTRPVPFLDAMPLVAALLVWLVGFLLIVLRNPAHGGTGATAVTADA